MKNVLKCSLFAVALVSSGCAVTVHDKPQEPQQPSLIDVALPESPTLDGGTWVMKLPEGDWDAKVDVVKHSAKALNQKEHIAIIVKDIDLSTEDAPPAEQFGDVIAIDQIMDGANEMISARPAQFDGHPGSKLEFVSDGTTIMLHAFGVSTHGFIVVCASPSSTTVETKCPSIMSTFKSNVVSAGPNGA